MTSTFGNGDFFCSYLTHKCLKRVVGEFQGESYILNGVFCLFPFVRVRITLEVNKHVNKLCLGVYSCESDLFEKRIGSLKSLKTRSGVASPSAKRCNCNLSVSLLFWTSLEILNRQLKICLKNLTVRVRVKLLSEKPLKALLLLKSCYTSLRINLLEQCGDIETNPGPTAAATASPNASRSTSSTRSSQVTKPVKPALQIVTYNVRGLGDKKKVRHLVNHCYKQCSKSVDSVFMLQETFVGQLKLLDYIWRGEYHLTSGAGNSLGCITLLSSPYKVLHSIDVDERGHILVLTKGNLNNAELILANVYAPNGLHNDKLDFFESVVQKVLELQTTYNCEKVILGGDLNLVFAEHEVKNRCISSAEKRMSTAVEQIFDTAELTDVWKLAADKNFTWTTSRNGKQQFSTLDRILFNKSKLILKETDVEVDWSLSMSDHAMVRAFFDDPAANRNPCNFIPRLDPRILEDQEARAMLDEEFERLMNDVSPAWNPHVKLEYCKMALRTAVFNSTGKLKAKYRDEEKTVNEDINLVVNELAEIEDSSARAQLLIHKLDDLRAIKRHLVEKIGSRIERRTARKWHNEGEMSNKYFFNLLNRKNNDEIKSIFINNEPCDNPALIESEIRGFYKNLYEDVAQNLETNPDFFRHLEGVEPNLEDQLVKALSLDELTATLRSCSDSAPGPDGIPYSFLKHCWKIFGPLLLNAWEYSLRVGELPPSHKVSYLRLIPKAGKDSRVISNLRPITLSNTDHKLITKTYASKLTEIISPSISQEQTAYIPNRLINDNIRSMIMTMDLANLDEAIDGVIVSLDAKKAFDSVDHGYIRRTLTAFGLNRFIPIFDVLYKGLKSDIILNGGSVSGYRILKGVKQGDALSCILFVMCIEPILRNIKNSAVIGNIRSNKLSIEIPNVYGYADDVNVVTDASQASVQGIFDEYQTFSKNSGLILNADKTEIIRFKKAKQAEIVFDVNYLDSNYRIESRDGIKINGILFFQDPVERENRNLAKVIGAMTKHLGSWSRRRLTLLGKILILKTYAVSQTIFLMQSIMLHEKSIKEINNVLYKYLWNKNFFAPKAPDRIPRKTMLASTKLGGFGMMDIALMNRSLALRAIGRMASSKHPFFRQIWNDINSQGFFKVTTKLAVDEKLKEGLKLLEQARCDALSWPMEIVLTNNNLCSAIGATKLSTILTNAGRQSIPVFWLLRRDREITLNQLTLAELNSVERSISLRRLVPIARHLISTNFAPTVNIPADLYPCKNYDIKRLSTLSSKILREGFTNDEDQMICIYKSGMLLTPGEVLNWTRSMKKLTSTKHRCALLRIAHGDVYTNERLARFGLINDPKCSNCDVNFEDLKHRFIDCLKVKETWQLLEDKIEELGLQRIDPNSIENALGAGQVHQDKLAFTIRAELLARLIGVGGTTYCARALVQASIKTIYAVEDLDQITRTKLKDLLNNDPG